MNLAFVGSMRGGEIGGLQWDDIIDPKRRVLYINKTIDRVDRDALETVSKTEVYFKFPCHDPRAKSIIVLKNTKEDGGSDRNCYLPATVYDSCAKLIAASSYVEGKSPKIQKRPLVFTSDLLLCMPQSRQFSLF